jgi:hypothetical protein
VTAVTNVDVGTTPSSGGLPAGSRRQQRRGRLPHPGVALSDQHRSTASGSEAVGQGSEERADARTSVENPQPPPGVCLSDPVLSPGSYAAEDSGGTLFKSVRMHRCVGLDSRLPARHQFR